MRAKKFSINFRKKLYTVPKIILRVNPFPFFKGFFILIAVVSMIIWIFVGGLLSIFIVQSWRSGLLERFLSTEPPQQVQQEKVPMPIEANLPGIGRVNIDCVKTALSDSSIKNMIQAENTSVLKEDEKVRFEKCIVRTNQ